MSGINAFRKDEKTSKMTQGLGVLAHPSLTKKWKKIKRFCLHIAEALLEAAEEIGISYGSCETISTNVLNTKLVNIAP